MLSSWDAYFPWRGRGRLSPRTDLAVPGMRTLQLGKERNGQIHVRIWLFWVTGEVTRPGSMFGCTDMALSPGSLHQRLHLGCGSCGARHRWGSMFSVVGSMAVAHAPPAAGSPHHFKALRCGEQLPRRLPHLLAPRPNRLRRIMFKVTKGEPVIIIRKRELLCHCEPVSGFLVFVAIVAQVSLFGRSPLCLFVRKLFAS